jgi:hypothetical protein
MIQWHCNFNLPDSIVQLDYAYIKVIEYLNINQRSEALIRISDYSGDVIIREYRQNFDRTFQNEIEIYEEIMAEFDNSILIP